jgi:hypothetical protein
MVVGLDTIEQFKWGGELGVGRTPARFSGRDDMCNLKWVKINKIASLWVTGSLGSSGLAREQVHTNNCFVEGPKPVAFG